MALPFLSFPSKKLYRYISVEMDFKQDEDCRHVVGHNIN